jgi:Tfp pilus assembly protein PilP
MRSAKPFWKVVAALALLGGMTPGVCAQARKPAKKVAPSKAVQARSEPATARPVVQRRDPFLPLVARGQGKGEIPESLPPGKAGLVVATVRLDGIVRAANGMIAVVANPQNRVYFLREGDRLYNGSVERINMESVTFRERGKDPFGNPLDRVVVKRLYPSAGEQR